jgi:hypothetical protein
MHARKKGTHPAYQRARAIGSALEAVTSLRVRKAHSGSDRAQPSCNPRLHFETPPENWLGKTSLRQKKTRARQRFLLEQKTPV